MDKTDNFINKILFALLCNPTVKSEPDKLLIISQVLQRQQYCYGNTFPK